MKPNLINFPFGFYKSYVEGNTIESIKLRFHKENLSINQKNVFLKLGFKAVYKDNYIIILKVLINKPISYEIKQITNRILKGVAIAKVNKKYQKQLES